ncbi:hypothetical protein [Bacillus sp. S/N-304-OC-R1]|uniref:hypothetical protein n=1 Tax=Bacillus sp. S/N-304-OC-R1 TaxID=2758034 RepID=UPI001C8EFF01|nr:hypothetical protein [Bacillus sp. S/N-304-OC-R1]MBY0123616.1 hypothetical protein [Bacillus sp. S/N-304-OC-R1]
MIQIETKNDIQLSIDTLTLVAKLTLIEKQKLKNYFTFNRRTDYFYSAITSKKPFFVLNLNPRNMYSYKYYNVMLILQNETLINMPESIRETLFAFDWKVKRMDIAFDSKLDYSRHVFLKPHGNSKVFSRSDWSGYYVGSNYSKSKLAVYDRNKKEQARKTDIEHLYKTRFEFRIRPKISIAPSIHNIDDDFIMNELSKYNVIEDAESMETTKWNINRLINLKKGLHLKRAYKDRWIRYGRKVQSELKQIVKEERIPFERLYQNKKESIFNWLTHKAERELAVTV